eukprot:c32333_g1_i1.p2 GENE.c32333_g1_i1~~c32333_g1_i1.p2  ORF type:complete len:478 (+),score=92.34 c32333_g1_i1:268-1701(+)
MSTPSFELNPLVQFDGRVVLIGFGSIGQGLLPMLLKHIGGLTADRVTIVTADERGKAEADAYGVKFLVSPLEKDNYVEILDGLLSAGDFIVNVSVDVSSAALMTYAGERSVLYLDTVVEPWAGGYTDSTLSVSARSNYAQREEALAVRRARPGGATAISCFGANPGLASIFVKQALLNLANDLDLAVPEPTTREGWASLAQTLGVTTIHVAERDTQVSAAPKAAGVFTNTWSVEGFMSEGVQPAELGWGTAEKAMPADGCEHDFGSKAAIYLMRPGVETRVRTWTPDAGAFHGFLITHNESISIADYLTVRGRDGARLYAPTVHYAYHPCDAAVLSIHELCGRALDPQLKQHILVDDIVSGADELGVLLAGHARNAYWFGSSLSIETARKLAPYSNATALQVTSSILGAVVYAIENPALGVIEPEEVDHRRILEIAGPYLGRVHGAYTEWTPVTGRGGLFPEKMDLADPWQFSNVRV